MKGHRGYLSLFVQCSMLTIFLCRLKLFESLKIRPLTLHRRSDNRGHREQFCMFDQGQHVDTLLFIISSCLQFDLFQSLTRYPVTISTKLSQNHLLQHVLDNTFRGYLINF